jgi:hypothetical protein
LERAGIEVLLEAVPSFDGIAKRIAGRLGIEQASQRAGEGNGFERAAAG